MTLKEQLHRSKTHKPGIDPLCPVCISKAIILVERIAALADEDVSIILADFNLRDLRSDARKMCACVEGGH